MIASLFAAMTLAIAPQIAPATDAQIGVSDPTVTELSDVVVEGVRTEKAARDFVNEIGAPPRGTRAARWHRSICISVSNMQPQAAQFVIDRMAARTVDLGLQVGEPGCRPNVVVLTTTDGAAMADRLVRESGLTFQPDHSATNQGGEALARFRTSTAAVRWWPVSMPILVDTGDSALTLPGDQPRSVTVRDASRLRSNVRYDLGYVIVVVDLTQTHGAPLGALSDYITMVALAQIDATADITAQPTVLNLFNPAGAEGLTDWDLDYLHALYNSPVDRATTTQQTNDLVHALVTARREDEQPETTPAP